MINRVHVENICPTWSFGLICIINASFTTLFPDSWVWCIALFRSLFFLLTFPEGVFQCDRTDWWLPSQWLTSQRECVDSFMAHGTLGTFPTSFVLFPLGFCCLLKRNFELTFYFIWFCLTKNHCWVPMSSITSCLSLSVPFCRHFACLYLSVVYHWFCLLSLVLGSCFNLSRTEWYILEKLNTSLFLLMKCCYIQVSVHINCISVCCTWSMCFQFIEFAKWSVVTFTFRLFISLYFILSSLHC